METEIKEEWKDIPEYEGDYQASNFGRIRSLNYRKSGKIKFLKNSLNGEYYRVILSKENKTKIFLIHQLIAMTFLGHKPDKHKLVIDHINSNKLDNRIENLRIVTQRENTTKERTLKSGLPTGVTVCGKKFRSRISINKIKKNIGLFLTSEEASQAYQNELQKV